jgi:hypothetical protein
VEFNDLAGDLTIEMSSLQSFVKAWWAPDDVVVVTGIKPSQSRKGVLNVAVPVKDFMSWTEDDIRGMSQMKDGEVVGTYVTLFPIKDQSKVELGKRGTEENVRDMYGTFIDFDIKPGAFESREELIAFLTQGDIPKPTILVQNGETGGLHAYWRLHWGESGYKGLLEMWHAFISSKTDVKIDRLIDLTRLSRLPSSIYWPKEGTNGKSGVVSVIWADGPTYSVEDIESLSKDIWSQRKERIQRLWNEDSQRKLDASQLAAELGVASDLSGWSLYAAIATVEENFNQLYTWDDILVPMGWTYLKNDGRGRREFARPGRYEKSATVDWPESPDIMSLLSESSETGLSDLKEAGIALTKYRVALRLLWNDDPNKMTVDIVNQMNGKQ